MEAVVDFEYEAEQEDELSLKVGDIISNVSTAEGGWWEGDLKGKRGMFPENFVSLVKKRDPPSSKKEEKQIATQRKSVRELANKFKDGVPMGGPPKKKEKKKKCKVLFDYKGENDDELDINIGDIVDFVKEVEEGWWEGSLNGFHGVFPSNFVEMIEDKGPPEEPAPAPAAPVPPPKEEKENIPSEREGQGELIKGKKVVGVGLGNIFGSGPIKLRPTAQTDAKEEPPTRPSKPSEPETVPEVAKREKASSVERAIVRFSYEAEQPDELSLFEGQIVIIVEKSLEDDGWWKGDLNGKIGVFPDNFVELIPNEEPIKPKKPPPPPAAMTTSKPLYPKLPEKGTAQGDGQEKSKQAEHNAPAVGKKAAAPPPIGKKPNAKPDHPLPARPTAPSSVKEHKAASLPKDTKSSAPPLSKDSKSSSFPAPQKDSKTSISASIVKEKSSTLPTPESSKENHVADNTKQEGQFDNLETTGQKLTHLTANRAKGPKKRPPSTVLTLNEGEGKEETTVEPARREAEKSSDRSHVSSSHKDRHPAPAHHTEHHTEQEGPSLPSHSASTHTESSHTPPPRPPEPVAGPPTASNAQTNKLIEQLQKEIQDLKANSVSKSAFNELRTEHDRLKQEFDNFKSMHTKKLRDVVLEVDEEKKLRLTTQVEIERVKKWMAETNV